MQQPTGKRVEKTRSQGNAQCIIQKGPHQVLFDVFYGCMGNGNGIGNEKKGVSGERDVGIFNGYISSAAYRKASIGLGEGRRVIDAITDHGHLKSLGLKLLYKRKFVFR